MITASGNYLTENNLLGRSPVYRATIIKGPRPILPSGFVLHWTFDETSGNRTTSYPAWPDSGSQLLTDHASVGSTAGMVSNCATFNGTTQYLSMAGTSYTSGDVSFGGRAWIYLTDNTVSRVIAGQWGNTSNRSWVVFYDQSLDRFVFRIANAAGTPIGVTATSLGAPALSTWYEIRWKRLGQPSGVMSIQVNTTTSLGTVDYTDANSAGTFTPLFSTSEDVRVGADRTDGSTISDFWAGRIDELTLWNSLPLTPEQEATLYDGGLGSSLPVPASKYTTYTFDNSHDVSSYADLLGTPTTAISALLPERLERKLEMAYSRFVLSTLTMRIKNQLGSTALFLAGSTGAQCQYDAGFWDLPGDYARLFTGNVTDVQTDEGDYLLTAMGMMDVALQTVIFSAAKTQLSSDINAILQTLPVATSEGFTNVDTAQLSFVVIDNEIMGIQGTRPNLLLGALRNSTYPFVIPPLIADGQAQPHSKGAEVRELVHLGLITSGNHQAGINNLHPVDLFASVILGFAINIPTLSVPISVNPKALLPYGLFNPSLMDTTKLNYTRNVIGTEFQMVFMDDEPTTAKDFLEKEILFPLALYPTESSDGLIGLLPYPSESDYNPPRGVGGGFDVIDDNHALTVPAYDKAAENRINQVHYYYDYNPITKNFGKLDMFIDDNLLKEHGKPLPLEIYSKGIRSRFDYSILDPTISRVWFWDTDRGLAAAAKRHLSRFGSRSSVLRVETILRDHIYECGDDVTAQFANVPDEVNATVTSINRPTRLEEVSIDFEKNSVTMGMLEHTSFQASVRKVTS